MSAKELGVGWVGTGRMGHAMVGRLLAAGHQVHVWNRTPAKAEDLVAEGAVLAASVGELAQCDVVFTTVSADADLVEVLLGPGGLLTQASSPSYVVDSSTVSETTSRRIRDAAADRGVELLACPVSGNGKVVSAGRLSMAVSGSQAAFRVVEPLLLDIAPLVVYVGEGERARLVKIAHNIFLGVVTQGLAEVTVLCEQAGVSRAAFLDFLNKSVLGSTFTGYKSPAFVNLDLTPTFTTRLLRKDLDLGLELGRRMDVAMPLAAGTQALLQAAIGRGHGEEDFAALLVEVARNSGLDLQPENVPVDDGLGKPATVHA